MIIGVVGKANVGKSTFFKSATLAEAEIANYPFTTIEKNEGVGFVRVNCVEKTFNAKCQPRFGYCLEGKRFVPVQLIDIAGLVPGANKGRGRGNQFLSDINEADALIHVVDAAGTTNENGEPVEIGTYDPLNDIRFFEEELDLWFLGILKKPMAELAKKAVMTKKNIRQLLAEQFSGMKITHEIVEASIERLGLPENPANWSDSDLERLAREFRKITKPMIIAANKADTGVAGKNIERMRKEFPNLIIVPCSSESELALKEAAKHGLVKYVPGEVDFEIIADGRLSERQRKGLDLIREKVLKLYGSTGVQETLNRAVFELLECMAVYPVASPKLTDKDGRVLPDCFLVPKTCTALEFAFKIHTDIGSKFIRAVDLKTKQTIGKEHQLKDGDVVEIITQR